MPETPERMVWRRGLADLWVHLRLRAAELEGRWAWYMLPRGALVALRRLGDAGALELRIAREETPATGEAQAAFETEVNVFLRYFGGRDAWEPVELAVEPTETGIARHFRAKAAPIARCARCGDPVPDGGLYAEDLCTACAMRAGRDEAAAKGRP